jgi:cytochrome P450
MHAIDVLRSTIGMATRPHDALLDIYRRFGPVCTLGRGPFRYVYLLGPEANRFILANSQHFVWREAFDALVVIDGEHALIVSDGEDHQRRRRLVTPAFGRRQLDRYADTMRHNVNAAIDTWRPGETVDLYHELRRVIRRSTIEVLFGSRLAADEPELGRLLQHALNAADRPPPMQQLQRLGTPAWRHAIRGRAEVGRRIRTEIEYRRRHPDDAAHDVLAALVDSRDDDGSALSDVEIVDQVISLIAAGYETTSAAMAWATHALLADTEVWKRAQDSVADSADWRYIDGAVSETLRLHPPGAISARKSIVPLDFSDVHIPADSMLIFSPYVTHRLPELWPEPLRFNPTRWDPAGPEYRKPGPHEYLPFGGGPHRCLGAAFATVEMTVLLEQLLTRTALRLEAIDARPVGLAAMRPRRGPYARIIAVD